MRCVGGMLIPTMCDWDLGHNQHRDAQKWAPVAHCPGSESQLGEPRRAQPLWASVSGVLVKAEQLALLRYTVGQFPRCKYSHPG